MIIRTASRYKQEISVIKATLMALALTTFASASALAEGTLLHRTDTTVIYSNIPMPAPKALYIAGGGESVGISQGILAVQFTTTTKVSATEIDAGINDYQGPDGVTLTLYSDFQGKPDHPIVSGIATGLGNFGDCCTLAVAKIAKTKLSAHTAYWVIATTKKNTTDIWEYNTTEQIHPQTAAVSTDGTTWTVQSQLPGFAVQVLGQ